MAQPRPSRNTIRQRVAALPLVESGEVLDHKSSLGALEDLARHDPLIATHLLEGVSDLYDETVPQLPRDEAGKIILTDEQALGLVYRGAIYGAAQVASDIGRAEVNLQAFRSLMHLDETPTGPEE